MITLGPVQVTIVSARDQVLARLGYVPAIWKSLAIVRAGQIRVGKQEVLDARDASRIMASALGQLAASGGDNGCSTVVDGSHLTCRSTGSGRSRHAEFGAERWCDPCIASDALDRAARLLP